MTKEKYKLNVMHIIEIQCLSCGAEMRVIEEERASGDGENTGIFTNTYKCVSCTYKARTKVTQQITINKDAPDNTLSCRLQHHMAD